MQTKHLITTDYQVITPAYGRDYKNKQAAKDDFLRGKDFVLASFLPNQLSLQGTYCSSRDFAPGIKVNIRYNKGLSVTTVVV